MFSLIEGFSIKVLSLWTRVSRVAGLCRFSLPLPAGVEMS